VKSYDYWINPSAAAHQEIRGCLEDLLAKRPNDATALARLTYMYLDEYRVGYNARPDPLGRARQAARRAVEIAPESPATNQALMAVLFVSGDRGRALALADRLLELNPYDPDLMADVGARFIQIGRYKEGVNLIHRAAALNPACPPWYDFFLFVAAYMQDDLGRASMAASRIGANDFALGFVARAIVAGHKGDHEQARAAIEQLIAIQPEFKRNPAAALARRNFTPEIRERLVRGLENAGLKS
jgi:tetratricopeptide (TPR) repeat protein